MTELRRQCTVTEILEILDLLNEIGLTFAMSGHVFFVLLSVGCLALIGCDEVKELPVAQGNTPSEMLNLVRRELVVGLDQDSTESFFKRHEYTYTFDTQTEYFGEDRVEFPSLANVKGRYSALSQEIGTNRTFFFTQRAYVIVRAYISSEDKLVYLYSKLIWSF